MAKRKSKVNDEVEDQNPGRRFIQPAGVWPEIEREISSGFPPGSQLRWLTYSFAPPEELVQFLLARKWELRVVACHPDEGVTLRPASWERWTRAFGQRPPTLLGLGENHEGNEEEFGFLHGKALAIRAVDGKKYVGFVGSFNLAKDSLSGNAETLVQLDGADARALWKELEELALPHPELRPILLEDCKEPEPETERRPDKGGTKPDRPLLFNGPSAHPSVELTEQDIPLAALDAKPPVDLLASTLREMLKGYPADPEHPQRGVQWRLFNELQTRAKRHSAPSTELLFLPVGVGKTFLALMWSLEALAQSRLPRAGYGRVIYLVSNRWIQQSVTNAMLTVANKAAAAGNRDPQKLFEAFSALVQVLRPSQLRRHFRHAQKKAVAIVADECHNWDPHAPTVPPQERRRWYYTHALNSLRGATEVRVLGLSATPCRFSKGRFDVGDFVARFCGAKRAKQVAPLLKLGDAIHGGLLAHPEFVPLLPKRQAEIRKVLSRDGVLASYGDYSKVVLQQVWRILDGDRPTLIAEILDEIDKRKARRIVVFTPPVGELADEFVNEFEADLLRRHRGATFVDFRTRAAAYEGAKAKFDRFGSSPAAPGKPAVLTTIDRFSEGVSVTDVDMLVQLRATLSPKIAVQSLGRGLRLDAKKSNRCTVLDAVGFEERIREWDNAIPKGPAPRLIAAPQAPVRAAKTPAGRVARAIQSAGRPLRRAEIFKKVPIAADSWSEVRGALEEHGIRRYGIGPHTVYGERAAVYVGRILTRASTKSARLAEIFEELGLETRPPQDAFVAALKDEAPGRFALTGAGSRKRVKDMHMGKEAG